MHFNTDQTVEYYNQNASAFVSRTINIDMSDAYYRFLEILPESSGK